MTSPPSARFAWCLVALVATGCVGPIAAPPSAPPTADAALARMHATFACANAVQANAKIDHFGEHGRVRGDSCSSPRGPRASGMDVVSPFGVALATLTCDGTRFGLADLRDKRFFIGPAAACNIARLTTVPVPGHVLVDLLRGEAPVLKHDAGGATIAWDPHGWWALTIPSTRDAHEEIHLAPRPEDWNQPWEQQRMRVLDVRVVQQGYVLYHAELSDHAQRAHRGAARGPGQPRAAHRPRAGPVCDAEVPRKIHVEVPVPEAGRALQLPAARLEPAAARRHVPQGPRRAQEDRRLRVTRARAGSGGRRAGDLPASSSAASRAPGVVGDDRLDAQALRARAPRAGRSPSTRPTRRPAATVAGDGCGRGLRPLEVERRARYGGRTPSWQHVGPAALVART